jgi:hypothetical protein
MHWHEDFYNLWTDFQRNTKLKVSSNRPLLFRSISVRQVEKLLSFVFGNDQGSSALSPGDFQLLLEWFDRNLTLQKFEYERSRILNNGYVALIILNLANITYPLIYHSIIRTILEYMHQRENVEMLTILLIHVFSYARKENSNLATESGMQLIDSLGDIVEFYDGHDATQRFVLEAIKRIQIHLKELGGSIKRISSYQLDIISNDVAFGLNDVFDFACPQNFQYFMVDHLCAVIELESSHNLLVSNTNLSQKIITRLLQIIQKDKVPEKTILKIGYIIGKLMPFSHKNVVHYPVSASCLGTLEIVIFEGLNDALYAGDMYVREIASQTLACILREESFYSFAETRLSPKTWESIKILKDRLANKKIKPPKPKKNYESIDSLNVWISGNNEDFESNLSNGILMWKKQAGILSFLPAILEAYAPMAENLFPFIAFENLMDLNFRYMIEKQVNNILSMSSTLHLPLVRSIIRAVDFIRRQHHPDSASPFENNKRWIDIDFLNLSKSAAISDMGYHALFFAEIALIDNPANLHSYLEIIAEIYKSIDDSDGFIGILMLMKSSHISESLINEKL